MDNAKERRHSRVHGSEHIRLHDRRAGGHPESVQREEQVLLFLRASSSSPKSILANSGNVVRLRLPTAAERQGDFSQSRDQNGNLITSIMDNTNGAPFPGNIIPQNRLYAPGLAVLNQYPMPNVTQAPGNELQLPAESGQPIIS